MLFGNFFLFLLFLLLFIFIIIHIILFWLRFFSFTFFFLFLFRIIIFKTFKRKCTLFLNDRFLLFLLVILVLQLLYFLLFLLKLFMLKNKFCFTETHFTNYYYLKKNFCWVIKIISFSYHTENEIENNTQWIIQN